MSRISPFRKSAVTFLSTRDLALLEHWTEAEWSKQYRWLDRSGLALPVAAQLLQDGMEPRVPSGVVSALGRRLHDNQERMNAMLDSLNEIQSRLIAGRIHFCCLKGFSLIPDCYSSIRERHQVDFDILVSPDEAIKATVILEGLGYKKVYADKSGEIRFARPWTKHLTANSWLYGVSEGPAVELHTRLWEPETGLVDFVLPGGSVNSIYTRVVCGVTMPCLAPAWQFLHLLLHVFRHLLASWVRLLSIYEIAVYRDREQENDSLWHQVYKLATTDVQLASACALVMYIVNAEFPGKLPEPLGELCSAYLSFESALWVKHFREPWLYADPPGTKLALLVQRQFCANPGTWRSYTRRRLLPLRSPHGLSEDASTRARRTLQYVIDDLLYRLSRLGYHLMSSYDYLRSAARWRRLIQSNIAQAMLML